VSALLLDKVFGASRHLIWYVNFRTGNPSASRKRRSVPAR
jgi:hypothetical protein